LTGSSATPNDRNRLGRSFGCERRSRAPRSCDYAHLSANQIGRLFRKPIEPAFCQAILDGDVLAFGVTSVIQTPTEYIQDVLRRSA
jgi:hypothetical protein